MKKLLTIALIIAMIACFTACGSTSDDTANEDSVGVANPMTEYDSLDALNEACGTVLVLPDGMNAAEESFASITSDSFNIAQYKFTADGVEYTYRSEASFSGGDISGVYINANPAFDEEIPSELEFNASDEYRVARWSNINGQFTVSVSASDISEEEFTSIIESFVEYSNPVPTGARLAKYYQDLAGDYQDKTSQRASMHIDAEDDCAKVQVSWSSSAFETTTWEMTLSLSEDGLLYYDDCTKTTTVTDDNEEETVTVEGTDGSGYFALGDDGTLYWTGAEEESCADCVFEK